MKFRRSIIRLQNSVFLLLGIVVFVVFLVMTVWGKDGMLDLIELNKRKDQIVNTNYRLLKENLLYLEEIQKLKQAKFVEQKARSDLGLVRPDEIVFVVQ